MFKVGDVVEGLGNYLGGYSFTGKGSICRVVALVGSRSIVVEVMTPRPDYCPAGERYEVEAAHFKLKETKAKEPVAMKTEALKIFYCQSGTKYGGDCGELAEHRISIPGLAVTLCAAHARAYLKGEKTLEAITCHRDGQICKPGYVKDRDYGYPFCTEECLALWQNRDRETAYASGPF